MAGTQAPFARVEVTVMAAGSHERDIGHTGKGDRAPCAMGMPFTAWKYMHDQGGP